MPDQHDQHESNHPVEPEPVESASPDGGELDGVDGHPVLELWEELAAQAEKLAVATSWSMSAGQARAAVAAGARVRAVVESVWLGQVRDLDSRPDAVAGARAGQVARTFLMHALNRSGGQAGADVRAARALDPDRAAADGGLPELGAAFAAGQVSRRHVDVAEWVMRTLPSGPARVVDAEGRTGADRVEEFLAEQAKVVDSETLSRMGREVLARLDPDANGGYDADAYRRRYLSMVVAPDGMTIGRFVLPGAQAAVVRAALESFSAPQAASEQPDQDGQQVLISDERTRQQRLAHALIAMAHAAVAARAATVGGEPAHVTILTDLDQLAAARATTDRPTTDPAGARRAHAEHPDGPGVPGAPDGAAFRADSGTSRRTAAGMAHCLGHGPISAAALAMLSCDARLRAVVLDGHGAVLHLGRAQRLASKAQRIALAARDRGCVIPGCAAPASICDAHHVTWWSNGGTTDIDMMALVCPRHHTDIHHGVWHLKMRAGVPWARPPAWVTTGTGPPGGSERWVQNTIHHTMDTARRLGQQLRLDRDPG